MQHAGNDYTSRILMVENDVTAPLHASQIRPNVMTESTQQRIFGEIPATRLEIVEVAGGLFFSPRFNCVDANI